MLFKNKTHTKNIDVHRPLKQNSNKTFGDSASNG